MKILRKTKENKTSVVRTLRLLGAAVLVLALTIVAMDTAQAQQIPRRLDSLQLIKPIAPAPVAPVDRLRQDIISAVNPQTGTVDINQLWPTRIWPQIPRSPRGRLVPEFESTRIWENLLRTKRGRLAPESDSTTIRPNIPRVGRGRLVQ